MEQVATAIKGMSIPGNTNIWDVYVALNANWHDKEVKFTEWFGPDAEKRSSMMRSTFILWTMTLRKARSGFICAPWMTKKTKNKWNVKKESARQEIDRLTDSLDFEPVNFYEVMARIRHLMCLL